MNLSSELASHSNLESSFVKLETEKQLKQKTVRERIEEELDPESIILKQDVGKFFVRGDKQRHKLNLSLLPEVKKKIDFSDFIEGKTSCLESKNQALRIYLKDIDLIILEQRLALKKEHKESGGAGWSKVEQWE